MFVLGPSLSLVLAVFGLCRRGRVAPWVPAVACVPWLALLIQSRIRSPSDYTVEVLLAAWPLAAIVCLALAFTALVRNWSGRRAFVLVGLCLPLPLMVLFLVYVIEELVAFSVE